MNERPYRGSRSLQEPRCTSLLAIASQGEHIKQHRPFFGENLKGFEPQPDARKRVRKIKGSKVPCARDRSEITKSRALIIRNSRHEILAVESQLLPDSELHASHRRLVSLCLLLAGRSCRAAVAHANLGYPLILGCGAVFRTLRCKSRQKLRNTPILRSKLEQRL